MIEIVGKRRVNLRRREVGLLTNDLLRGPTVAEVISDDLRHPDTGTTLKPGGFTRVLMNVRIIEDRHDS
ncbi:hypothetical protein BH20VER1_BH20VER1_17140 [soil metagenome]